MAGLIIPSFRVPTQAEPLRDAFARISHVSLGAADDYGAIAVAFHPDAASAGLAPLETRQYRAGIGLPPLGEMFADPEFAEAVATVEAKLLGWLAGHPDFAGAEVVIVGGGEG